MTCCSVTTVSPLLYGLWLSLILFWFSIDFYDVLFGGHHFHSARAPLPFCFIAFLASHRRVGLENNQNIGKAIFYTIYKTIFIGIDLRQIFRTSNTPRNFGTFFSQFRDFVTSRCLKLSDYYIFDRKIFYMSYMKSIKMSLMWNLPPKTPVYVGQCQCPQKICFYCDNCFYLDSSKLCL